MILYKYYPDNIFSYRSLAVRGLYCHYPKNMNDPFECLGYVERIISKEQIEIFKNNLDKNIPLNKHLLTFNDLQIIEFINAQRKEIISKYAFCSLSENYIDISMWSHYSSSHTGFVLELEFKEEEITDNFQKVNYVDDLPPFKIIQMAQFLNGEDDKLNYLLSDVSIKSKNWKNEKEWRIWRNRPAYYHYEKHNVKKIYFGINCTMETKAVVVKLVADINKKATYFQMKFGNNPIRLIVE